MGNREWGIGGGDFLGWGRHGEGGEWLGERVKVNVKGSSTSTRHGHVVWGEEVSVGNVCGVGRG